MDSKWGSRLADEATLVSQRADRFFGFCFLEHKSFVFIVAHHGLLAPNTRTLDFLFRAGGWVVLLREGIGNGSPPQQASTYVTPRLR